jgi:hypothetical protein
MASDTRIEVPAGQLVMSVGDVKLLVHQRGSLLATVRMLAEQARTAEREDVRHFSTIAATVCAQAAAEGILNEWAHDVDPTTYKRLIAERWPFVRIVEELLPKIGATLPPNIVVLSSMKNALSHPEPDNQRSGQVGEWVAGDGAQRALAVVESLDSHFFPNGRPAQAKGIEP